MNTYSRINTTRISAWLVLLLVISSSDMIVAQTPISLNDAIIRAKSSNHSILLANQSITVQEAQYELTKGYFQPYVGAQLTDIITNNPLNVFGFKLLQKSVKQADFNPELLNNSGARNNFNLALNTMMPLFNPEARAEQEAVMSQIKMKAAMAQRTSQGVELEVIKSYYLLLLTQHAIQVHEETFAAAQSNYAITNNYFKQGLILKSDLLDMQVMVNQSELALSTAKMNFANAQSYFNLLLNTNTHIDFTPTDKLSDTQELVRMENDLNVERADFLAIQHGINSMEMMSKAASKSFIPKLKAFGSLGLNDQIPFSNNAGNYQVGLTLSWDIYKGKNIKSTISKNKAEIVEKEIELAQIISNAQLEIIQTERAIEDITRQIEIHDLSISQLNEALQIRKNRFEQGLEKSTDIINAETQLSHKKLERLNSLFELNVKVAYLDFLLN